MQGFDTEFNDLDHYIRVITDRIWEGKRLQDIERYYSTDCAVESPNSVTIGTSPVVEGTRATLAQFPDRRLLAEDIIVSGDDIGGYLSSHRIFSPMTHIGSGRFGEGTGKSVYVRTIADCVCINNLIVHEWLVRDQAAIARQIGIHERDLAKRWLKDQGGVWKKAFMPRAPSPYTSALASCEQAMRYRHCLTAFWKGDFSGLSDLYAKNCLLYGPGGQVHVGHQGILLFWQQRVAAFADTALTLEHLTVTPRPERADAMAARWRVQARHQTSDLFGQAEGASLEVMAIVHAEWINQQISQEFVLIDDVSIWMQIMATKPS